MKKRFLYIAIGITSFVTLLISCGNNGSPSKNYHVVTFDTHGGSQVPSQNVEHGNKAHKPDDPNKPGYEFVTWTYKGEEWSFIGYSVTENITLDANWSAITYSIEYNLDGGTNNPSNPKTYTVDDEFNLYSPAKEGYSFAGWTLNGEQISKISKGTFGNLILTATWTIRSYNLTVVSSDLTKGTVSGSGTYVYNSSVTITATANEDYAFLGWFSDELFNNLLSDESSYTFEMPGHDFSIYGYFVSFDELGISFSLSDDNQYYTLDKYEPSFTYVREIIIPSCYKGLTVLMIGDNAFSDCSSLTSITIPDSVIFMGSYAFSGCSSLTSVNIPDRVTSIGDFAFNGCSNLTSITIPDSLTYIGDHSFSDCSKLTSITIPDSVSFIGSYAFSGCPSSLFNEYGNARYLGNESNPYFIFYEAINSSLDSCDISDKCVVIASNAFYNCSSLTSITIPDSVIFMGNYAFSGCSSLTSVNIPDSVTRIGNCAFENCSKLTSITITDSVTYIGYSAFSGCPSSLFNEYGNAQYLGNESNPYVILFKTTDYFMDSCEISDKCVVIASNAFSSCKNLTSITIPNSVRRIEDFAFLFCTSLTSITIPDSVTSIGIGAFNECSSLTSITIPHSVTSIQYSTFSGCSSLTSIIIPNSITSIDYYAFYECNKMNIIYFKGTSLNEWNQIEIKVGNESLTSADLYFYSESQPIDAGYYWHYVDGAPIKW